jgi:hypothetical protein
MLSLQPRLTYSLFLFILYLRSKQEIYRHLSIDIINGDDGKEGEDVKYSVEKSLAHFYQPETREIKCEKCDDGVDASQTIRILSRYVRHSQSIVFAEDDRSNLFCFCICFVLAVLVLNSCWCS